MNPSGGSNIQFPNDKTDFEPAPRVAAVALNQNKDGGAGTTWTGDRLNSSLPLSGLNI